MPSVKFVSVLLLDKLIVSIVLHDDKSSDELGRQNFSVDEGDQDKGDNNTFADTTNLGQKVQPWHLDHIIDLNLVMLTVGYSLARSDCLNLEGYKVFCEVELKFL